MIFLSPERDLPLEDQNKINQHDEHYMALRAKANKHGDLMAQSFQESHEAYSRGDRALAKELSGKGKQHERTMESLNAEASAWIFRRECGPLSMVPCQTLFGIENNTVGHWGLFFPLWALLK